MTGNGQENGMIVLLWVAYMYPRHQYGLIRHDRAGWRDAMDGLGRDIRDRRRVLGLRQRDLSDLAGTSERFIRELEHGKPSVRLDKVVAVLGALGLELRALARP